MAAGSRTGNRSVIPQARQALDKFKYEIAYELNLPNNILQSGYWGNLPSRDCGAVGGHMVRRMIEAAEQSLVEQAALNVRAGFQVGYAAAAQTSPEQRGFSNISPNVNISPGVSQTQ